MRLSFSQKKTVTAGNLKCLFKQTNMLLHRWQTICVGPGPLDRRQQSTSNGPDVSSEYSLYRTDSLIYIHVAVFAPLQLRMFVIHVVWFVM